MLAIMGVAVAITYTRLSSERRTTADGQAQMEAFAVAQSGLSRYLSTLNAGGAKVTWPVSPATSIDVTYNDLPGGTATVSIMMIRESTTTLLPAVYAITSRGVNTSARRYGGTAPSAERTVATYALWTPAPLEMYGAFTSLSGINKNGTSGDLSGYDRCGAAPAIPGVAVPGGGYTGPTSVIQGNPEDTPADVGTGGVGGTAKDSIDIDWAGIVAWPNTTIFPDHRVPSGPWPANFSDWPVVRVDNAGGPTFEIPNAAGKGILIVTGNVALSGAVGWEGLILVGGTLTSNGANQVFGAVVTGLNIKLGIDPGQSAIANGTKTFQYDSCSLKRALGNVGSIQRVRNGWIDTWPSY
jgi:hypothetical protein